MEVVSQTSDPQVIIWGRQKKKKKKKVQLPRRIEFATLFIDPTTGPELPPITVPFSPPHQTASPLPPPVQPPLPDSSPEGLDRLVVHYCICCSILVTYCSCQASILTSPHISSCVLVWLSSSIAVGLDSHQMLLGRSRRG